MASLTPIQPEALTLAYFGGYTQSQVAQLLKLPLGTVKTRIRDGRSGSETAGGGGMSEIHGAVGSYVANALDPDELNEFEAHLAVCPTRAREVGGVW